MKRYLKIPKNYRPLEQYSVPWQCLCCVPCVADITNVHVTRRRTCSVLLRIAHLLVQSRKLPWTQGHTMRRPYESPQRHIRAEFSKYNELLSFFVFS